MNTKNRRQPAVSSQGFDSSPLTFCSSLLLAFFICQFSFVGPAFGAEAASHGAEWKEWLWKILNFGILVFILVKFVGKPLKAFLHQRTELIEKTLKEAREAKELAARGLAEAEKRLGLKEAEIEEILAHAEQSAKSEHDLLISQGEQMKERILEHAKAGIDYELGFAKNAIKTEAVEIAMELAEKKMGRLSEEKQLRLIEESLVMMEKR